jgi:hypothetical protein
MNPLFRPAWTLFELDVDEFLIDRNVCPLWCSLRRSTATVDNALGRFMASSGE